ncbi:hypothetical protein ACFYU5_35750 [Nocardia aobensis]|uniref:Diadenosine tetraphosphate hydrolase n=1 Tax=Nocardia aobensis TaxID=257277 RepID=A0ABW6PF24_9NOCA
MTASCRICAADNADESAIVFRDDLWTAHIVPGFDVPGWFFLRTIRHAERLVGLDDNELATFARRARDLTAAVTSATGSEAAYMLMFGDNNPHFHVLIAARGAEVSADRRGPDIMKLRYEQTPEHAARAMELVPKVRQVYQEMACADEATAKGR